MVQIQTGILVTCDPAMKQFLLHLDETNALGQRFVLQDLDPTHLLITAEVLNILKTKIDDLLDQFSFTDLS
ncbi:transcription factor B5 [Dermatophagoides pteronyssinus]|uniref:General transcription and DNA repair factor IIH subunit TFB5 n=1 Tax=Dermatophagoides pteronyssinus TaxID=6956 RepID=A0ABQ8JIP1_DERPT|nr:General transcription factor IIH subunit 5 [Dermatophagoides pteronyssinus]